MRYFILGCFAVGALVVLIGLIMVVSPYQTLEQGVWTPATVVEFKSDQVIKRRGRRNRWVTVYVPVVQYHFLGKSYRVLKENAAQESVHEPLARGDEVEILCLPHDPGHPYLGTIPQLILPCLGMMAVGAVVLLVGLYFWFVERRDEAEPTFYAPPEPAWAESEQPRF